MKKRTSLLTNTAKRVGHRVVPVVLGCEEFQWPNQPPPQLNPTGASGRLKQSLTVEMNISDGMDVSTLTAIVGMRSDWGLAATASMCHSRSSLTLHELETPPWNLP